MGSPNGREPYGDRVPVVVAGVTTGQGGRESRPHGRRGTGDRTPTRIGRYAKCKSAETVLGVLRERGRQGLSCDELYRQLFNPQLYLLAYGRIYANHGAMTPGATRKPRTVCPWRRSASSSTRCATSATDSLRCDAFTFPRRMGRRVRWGCRRGRTNWSAKWCAWCLEAYYEPQFSDHSHGFRPGRGCHTALREVADTWTGTTWFIEGDISDCFGSLNHEILIGILSEKIRDEPFPAADP